MWESLKEVWPKAFLTTTFLLIIYGLYCGVKMIFKDEKKRRTDKKWVGLSQIETGQPVLELSINWGFLKFGEHTKAGEGGRRILGEIYSPVALVQLFTQEENASPANQILKQTILIWGTSHRIKMFNSTYKLNKLFWYGFVSHEEFN